MATTPPTMPNITIVKRFTYRGDTTEEWLNTYCFDNGKPTTDSRWKALADAIIAEEKKLYQASCSVVRAFGHDANARIADWSYDYLLGTGAVAGTFGAGVGTPMPGDVAAWIKYTTTQRTSKGKPIFLRNYYHGVTDNGTVAGGSAEQLNATMKTAYQAFGNLWVAGFSDGVVSHRRAGPRGAIAQAAIAGTYLTTRTLKKRGKRVA